MCTFNIIGHKKSIKNTGYKTSNVNYKKFYYFPGFYILNIVYTNKELKERGERKKKRGCIYKDIKYIVTIKKYKVI